MANNSLHIQIESDNENPEEEQTRKRARHSTYQHSESSSHQHPESSSHQHPESSSHQHSESSSHQHPEPATPTFGWREQSHTELEDAIKTAELRALSDIPSACFNIPVVHLTEEDIQKGNLQKVLEREAGKAVKNGAVFLQLPRQAYKDLPHVNLGEYKEPLTVNHKKVKRMPKKKPLSDICWKEKRRPNNKKNKKNKRRTGQETGETGEWTLEESQSGMLLDNFIKDQIGKVDLKFLEKLKNKDIHFKAVESEPLSAAQFSMGDCGWDPEEESGLKDALPEEMAGITRLTQYISGPLSCFPIHTEDGNFYSWNLMLAIDGVDGQKLISMKVWFVIPKSEENKLENFFRSQNEEKKISTCKRYWKHKLHFPDVEQLLKEGISVGVGFQFPGMVCLTSSYHFGYNTGVNFNIGVNMANQKSLLESQLVEPCDSECEEGWTTILKVGMDQLNQVRCPVPGCPEPDQMWANSCIRNKHYNKYHKQQKKENGQFMFDEILCLLCPDDKNKKTSFSDIWKHQLEVHGINLFDRTCRLCRHVEPYCVGKGKQRDPGWKRRLNIHFENEHTNGICKGCKKGFKIKKTRGKGAPNIPEGALELEPNYEWVRFKKLSEAQTHDCNDDLVYPE
jgi:hypothetical protein